MRTKHSMKWFVAGLVIIAIGMAGPLTARAQADHSAQGKLILVDQGVSAAPIVIPGDAPLFTRRAADELAQYIEKISGAKPPVVEGAPQPMPEHAIWVGYQPVVKQVFPALDFDFKNPEEILIAANANHLVIAGRDRWDPEHQTVEIPSRGRAIKIEGVQQEYGTVNAVYTFLQDDLGVRWLWPGELGEDVIRQETLAFAPFARRYHPSFRGRSTLFVFSQLLQNSGYGISKDWTRRQRLQLDSMEVCMGHAFKTWWERFHETHPDYFALQPDGTRSGYPTPEAAKMCESNPGVWAQWINEVAEQLKQNPNQTVFNAAPNDGYLLGNCVCENCRAWDSPDADPRPSVWQGLAQPYPALSDRDVTFANHLARLLKERYPDKEYYVSMLAYGNSRPAPKKAVPAENVIIVNVANMFWDVNTPDKDGWKGKTYAEQYAHWGNVTTNHVWRPNTGDPAGWQNALPDIPIARVMESFQFAVSNRCIGIGVDSVWEQWANQGPLYYVLAQMVWNPAQEWRTVMDDYYQRGFGPAAGAIKAYWQLMEDARNRKVDQFGTGREGYAQVYNQAFFDQAYGYLDQAAANAAGGDAKYLQRIGFVRVGLDGTKLMAELRVLGGIFSQGGAGSDEAADQARVKWAELEALCNANPIAFSWGPIRPNKRMAAGGLFHPDSMKKTKAAPAYTAAVGTAASLQPAEQAGWELVFSDDFERNELGDDWKSLEGTWTVADGALRGAGTLVSTRGFPGDGTPAFQRMEFEVVTDVKPTEALGQPSDEPLPISDFSSVIHGKVNDPNEPDFLKTGYFFQFGWKMNKRTRIQKAGTVLIADNAPETLIERDKVQQIVVENDDGALRMFVDGKLVIDCQEDQSILGDGHDRVGLYFFTAAKVLNVKVYVKRLSSGLDLE